MKRTHSPRRRAGGPRRPRPFRPEVLTLEGRLPPGDALLGALALGAMAAGPPDARLLFYPPLIYFYRVA